MLQRIKQRLIGSELTARQAEEKRLRKEEKTGVGWKVPKSAEAGDWPKVLIWTVILYGVTFLAVLILIALGVSIDWIFPARHRFLHEDSGQLLRIPFKCANFVGAAIPVMFVLMLLFFPRVKVTLVSDGILERLGKRKELIPYGSIRKICIAPSRRRRSLQCLAVLTSDERAGEKWHRFDIGEFAPVREIIAAFESKGLSVEVVESTDGVST